MSTTTQSGNGNRGVPAVMRNAPCPCGSGKRYKHCHGSLAVASPLDRALALRAACELEGARAVLEEAARNLPHDARTLNLLGVVQHELLDLDAAERSFQRAIELEPGLADAHFNLGILYLALGDYPRGWKEYEWRTRRPGYADYAHFPFGMPRWQGEPLSGKRILVHGEQGFGDTIQCMRFLEPLAREAAGVDVFCQPALVPLMQRMRGVGSVWGTLDQRPTHDFHAPILDVAAHFLPTCTAPHWFGPYLTPLAERRAQWSAELVRARRPLVGFAWKGSAKQVNDRLRSLGPEDALALTRSAAGVQFVNLQAGERALDPGWIDAGPRLRDWDDTLAVIDALDLVIGVDTAVVHVAGAMAKPVWTLRWFSPDWRWGARGEETAWYPSMRLLRQRRAGDWSELIETVATRLAALATSRSSPGRGEPSPS